MSDYQLNHFSPVFANKHWADDSGFIAYFTNLHKCKVEKEPMGKRQWGRQRGLYSQKVESALDHELENQAANLYERLCRFEELDLESRIVWAQFLLSQIVRTPTFMRYEQAAKKVLSIGEVPLHNRVGCKDCGDLGSITSRSWCFILAHPDDFFVRTDNPVLLSGFIERPETCLFYPLTPHIYFVARGMYDGWVPHHPDTDAIPQSSGFELGKGDAWMLNYYFVRAAERTLIISSETDGDLAENMIGEILGIYPQPPFMLHHTSPAEAQQAFESIRMLMSATDGVMYPAWMSSDLEKLLPPVIRDT